LALGVVAVVAGTIGLYFSPVLRVQNIDVTGTSVLSAENVLDVVSIEDDSMLQIDTSDIAERVNALPMVLKTEVRRSWPQTVRIEVTERTPWGYWMSGESIYVIDGEGYVLTDVIPAGGALAIHATDPAPPLAPGDRVDGDAVFLTQVLLQRVQDGVNTSVTAVEFSKEFGLSIETTGGYQVVIGDSQNFDHKIAVWEALETQLGTEAMAGHVLDLRFGDKPSLQPLETGGDET
jgi:cell division protein FtsQ